MSSYLFTSELDLNKYLQGLDGGRPSNPFERRKVRQLERQIKKDRKNFDPPVFPRGEMLGPDGNPYVRPKGIPDEGPTDQITRGNTPTDRPSGRPEGLPDDALQQSKVEDLRQERRRRAKNRAKVFKTVRRKRRNTSGETNG